MLTLCFNACLKHGFLPDSMIHTILVPIIKDKTGDVTSKNNYRPIALASVISKIFEVVLLNRCEHLLYTTDNQFGFKSHHSTDLCTRVVPEVIAKNL